MDFIKLQNKINQEIQDEKISENFAESFKNKPDSFSKIVEIWLNGEEKDYEFNGITLAYIQEKEKLTYLEALLRMCILMDNPNLAEGYKQWTPSRK